MEVILPHRGAGVAERTGTKPAPYLYIALCFDQNEFSGRGLGGRLGCYSDAPPPPLPKRRTLHTLMIASILYGFSYCFNLAK